MSSTTLPTTLQEDVAASRLISRKVLVRSQLTAYSLFGCLFLLDSLYLALCYITFDFFGAFNSPFFSWLRAGALVAQVLYFPVFAGAILSLDLRGAGPEKHRRQLIAGACLVLQIVAGFLLYFCPGAYSYFGWALVYGPNVRMPAGELNTYFEALACFVPLAWVSALHIAAAFRAAGAKAITNTLKLSSFIMAAIAASLLFELTAIIRLRTEGQVPPLSTLAFVMGAHLVLFTGIFAALQWIRIIANRFPNPGLAQFGLRCMAAWVLLALVLRKIVFALLAFNDHYADWYAAALALGLVMFPATLTLKIRQYRNERHQDIRPRRRLLAWSLRIGAVAGIAALFYLCAVMLVPIDWAHVMGSIGVLLIWAMLLWFFVIVRRSEKKYTPAFVGLLTFACVGGIAGTTMGAIRGHLADSLEQYGDQDTAAFVIQHAFKPALQDDQYTAWYDFLNQHASIRPAVSAPEVPLVADLKPVQGRKPHIFILVIDALRRDYVSAYNPAVHFTPNLDAFARESVLFQKAYSQYAGTALADPALFSGYQQINKTFVHPLSRENNLQPLLMVDGYDSYISFNTIVGFLSAESHGITPLYTDRSNQLDFGPIAEELKDDLLKRKDKERPIFAFAQPTNVHTLSLAWHGSKIEVKHHPGFNDEYASAVERVDETFGKFIAFLKQQGLYENSIVLVTADHGESLGEMGRESHVTNVTPEVIEVPLIIHLPEWQKSQMVWDAGAVATLQDITPTLYYLLGHHPLNSGDMLGHSLFALTANELKSHHPDHYFLMSSYGAVFGILSGDTKSLFMVDAVLHRNYYYDLADDPRALKNRVTVPIRDRYEPLIREHLEKIDQFYGVSEQELER